MEVLKVDFTDTNAPELFTRSLKNTGFGVLTQHPIDLKLIEDVYQEWVNFFASNDKNNYLYNVKTQDGFFPQHISEVAKGYSAKDIKEYYHYYPWGQFPNDLTKKTNKLFTQLNQVAVTLLQWIEAYLPDEIRQKLSMPLSKMITNSQMTLLRILHYPPLVGSEPEGAVRAAAHGDINLLTVLVGATTSGLQVQDIEGKWHDVPCDRSSLAINIGDMLDMCTEGTYRSTLHRVINPIGSENVSRLSMPLFLHPNPDVLLSQKHTADSFLKERLNELGVA